MGNKTYTGIDNLEILKDAKNYNNFLRNEVIRNASGAVTVLDFGAGIGLFPSAIRDMGLKIICVESDQGMLNRLRVMGFEAYSSIEDIIPESIDYIYSLNVLEHIEDDLHTLRQLYSRLHPGGKLFLYVPAFNFLFTNMDKKVGHFRRYKKVPLIKLVQNAGFEVRQAIYVDSLGFFATLLYKYFGNKAGDLNSKGVTIYDTIAFPLSRLLDRALGGLFGKNLMISCIRPY